MAVKIEVMSEIATSRNPAKVLIYENERLVAEVIGRVEYRQGADGDLYPCVVLNMKYMKYTAGSRLKSEWMKMPVEFFEPLTFGELKVGQKFICLPLPGDNSGHGGFTGTFYIFTKTHEVIKEAAPGLPYGIPHGRATNDRRNVPSDFPHSSFVILVE